MILLYGKSSQTSMSIRKGFHGCERIKLTESTEYQIQIFAA